MLIQAHRTTPRLVTLALFGITLLLTGCGGGGPSGGMISSPPPAASNSPFYPQWGATPQHSGAIAIAAQQLTSKLADIVYDPFVTQQQNESDGELLAHYQATLTDGNDFYMESKSGTYPSCNPPGNWTTGALCGPNAWNQLVWNVTRYTWENGQPVLIWTFASDWKPEPNGSADGNRYFIQYWPMDTSTSPAPAAPSGRSIRTPENRFRKSIPLPAPPPCPQIRTFPAP